jgi:predicted RNA-binding Zn ribbon-like protein
VRVVGAHPVELLLPDEPPPVRLMNTTWTVREEAFDALEDVSDLRIFLAAIRRPVPSDLEPTHLAAIHGLRIGLRTLAGTIDGPAPAGSKERGAAVETINGALALAPAVDVLMAASEGLTLSRADGSSFFASLGRLAREGAEVLTDRSRPLRACHAPGCGLYFVRNHQRRRWCGTDCGNRVRAARYYQRHRGSGSS